GGLAMTRPVALGTAPHAPARARPGRHPGRPGGLAPDPYAGDAGPDDLRAHAAEGRLLQRHPALRGVLSRRRPAMRRTPRRALRAWSRSSRSPARLLGALPQMDRTRPGAAAEPPPRARLAPRAPLRAAPRRPLLGRRPPAEPDLPQRRGRRRPRLGDGVP